MSIITCKQCGNKIEVDSVLEEQVKERVLAAEQHRHKEELEKIKDEQAKALKAALDEATKIAAKKLAEKETKIREEAEKTADDKAHLRQLELEKKLSDTQKSLEEANRKARQGSQQTQGEVLEIEIEQQLLAEFPTDDIEEIKKGARGADIKQTVKTSSLQKAGLLLWETKNGKWQPAWVGKFKNDVREAKADMGIIVSQEMPPEYGDMQHLEQNVWVVKPKLTLVLASTLRSTMLRVYEINNLNVGKDAKMESLFTFISGPEFRNRVESIIENYGHLQEELEKEKRSAQLRWSRQEKSMRAVIDNTIGMYGDLQGVTNRALPTIKSLELDAEDNPEPLMINKDSVS